MLDVSSSPYASMLDALNATCVDPDTAASYAEHRLSLAEVSAVEQHIDQCSSCRELISAVAKSRWSEPSTAGSSGSHDGAALVGGVLPRGTRVGPFEIDQPLDAGGMGLVYSAHDSRLDRRVALKCVRELRGRSDQLLREAKMMAQLSHPNVVPVFDVIEAHGQIFLAMELVVGRSVRQWLDAQHRCWTAVIDVFIAAGAGLAAAHAANIIHGDVKPANILLGDDGRVRVADFGLSSSASDEGAELSSLPSLEPRGPRGTPAYMAPEQRAGDPCDASGDQFAFCVGLHEALFGALPGAVPAQSSAKPPKVPRALRRILARGLASESRDRYRSMNLLLADLRATRSSRLRWIMAAVLVALVFAGAAYGMGRRGHTALVPELCTAASPRLATPWTPETRAMVQRSFAATKLSYAPETLRRVEANLDRWTAAYEATRTSACERDFDERPSGELSTKLSCLEDRAREARALISQFSEVDATIVLNAIAASDQLAPVDRCDAVPTRRIATPDSPEVQHLRDEFAHARALLDSGKFRDALTITRALVEAADKIRDPALQSAARVMLGANQARLSDPEHAGSNLLEAVRLAEAAQDDRVRAQAWSNLIQNEYWRGHYEQVVFMQSPAIGATERAGDVWLHTEILLMLGGSLSQLDRVREAQPMFEEAVRLRRQLYGDKDRRLAFALSALGNAHSMQGNLEAGTVAHRQALEIAEAALGSTHPNVGILHNNLADDYLYGLDAGAAVRELDKGIAILEAANGSNHRDVGLGLVELGFAELEVKQPALALAAFERANAVWLVVNREHPGRGQALVGRYRALEALGRPTSVADLEIALPLGQKSPPFERARIQFTLGNALSGPRAIELVKSARAGFATVTLPLAKRELAETQAWLDLHDAHGVKP